MKKTTTFLLSLILISSMHSMTAMNAKMPISKKSVALAAYRAAERRAAEKQKKDSRTLEIMQQLVRDPMIVGCYGVSAVALSAYAGLKIAGY